MDMRFYATTRGEESWPAAAGFCQLGTLEVWTPSMLRVVPRGLPAYPFAVFWLFHQLRVFKNRQYRVILIRDGRRVIHCSTIIPCYFRFPFMHKEDIQVGVW